MNDKVDYSRHYKHWHDDSDAHAKMQARGFKRYIAFLGLGPTARVLDVGCGMGLFVMAALESGVTNVVGVDSSAEQLAAARARGLPVEHVEDLSQWLGSRGAGFDAIFLFDFLEHVPVEEQLGMLRDLHWALKPGGVLLARVPNANSTFAARFRWIDWTHRCSFTEHSLDFVLFNAGFERICVRADDIGRFLPWLPRPTPWGLLRAIYMGARRLQAIAEFGFREGVRMPLTINIVGTARKPERPPAAEHEARPALSRSPE